MNALAPQMDLPMLLLSREEVVFALRDKIKDRVALTFALLTHFPDQIVYADFDTQFHRFRAYFVDTHELVMWKLQYL